MKGERMDIARVTLQQLRYFRAIVEEGSMGAGADILGISQSALSRSIAALENELGIPVFERTGRLLRLNAPGRLLFAHTRAIEGQVNAMRKGLEGVEEPADHLDIGYVSPLIVDYLPRLTQQFIHTHTPRPTVTFHEAFTDDLVHMVDDGILDMAFGAHVPQMDSMIFHPVIDQKMVVIAPPHHPLGEKERVDVGMLEKYPVVGYTSSSGMGHVVHHLYGSFGIKPHIACEVPNERAVIAFVSYGFGIAVVPDVPELAAHDLCVIPLAGDPIHTVYLMYAKNRFMSRTAHDFIDFISAKTASK